MKIKLAWFSGPLALGAAAVVVAPTTASAADASVAVLGIEASEQAPETLAAALTDALRQRVSATKGFRLVPGRDLVEVKLVFSCPDEAPSCMAQAGKSLGASKLIFGGVKKSTGDSYVVTLKMLDTNRGVVDAFVAEQIARNQSSGPAMRGPVQKWFAGLTGQGGGGVIKVRSDVIGAQVMFDGTPTGTIGTDDVTIPGVTAGKHEITVSKPGYETTRREVNLAAGETQQVDVKLPRLPGTAPAPAASSTSMGSVPGAVDTPTIRDGIQRDEGGSKTVLKTASWAVLGAGVVGLAFGVKYGADVQDINSELDDYRRFPCTGSETGLCNVRNQPAKQLTTEQTTYVNLKKADGRRLETFQYISYGVGSALVITSGYLFYKAYFQNDGAESAARRGPQLTLLPVLTAREAGFGAHLRF